jgi:MFS family permease
MVLTGTLFGQLVWMQFSLEQTYHVQPWAYSLITCGAVFIDGLSMGLLVPLADTVLGSYKASLIGILFLSGSYLIMGPSPWLPFLPTNQVWLPILGFTIWAVGSGFPFAIFAALATNIAIGGGWSENDAALQISSVQVIVSGAGVAFGPIVFMAITEQVGVRQSSNYMFVLTLALLGGLWLILVWLNPTVATTEPVKESPIAEAPPPIRKASCFAGICQPRLGIGPRGNQRQ